MTLEQEIELDRGMLVGQLRPYIETRAQRDSYGKHLEKIAALLKNYLERHSGEEIYDGETGIVAKLTERHGSDVYETERMDAKLIRDLHKVGALRVDPGVIKALAGQEIADRAKRYVRPGPVTVALDVRAAKE